MPQTIIGSTIIIEGEIEGGEDLIVQGTIKGKITSKDGLFVQDSGVVEADVETQNVEVSGKLTGNIVASNKVEIKKEGKMLGDIHSPRILIADGAVFKGNIDMGKR